MTPWPITYLLLNRSRRCRQRGEHFNRLVFEKSPYLLQHAANPVDWYPWGEEALRRAFQPRVAEQPVALDRRLVDHALEYLALAVDMRLEG